MHSALCGHSLGLDFRLKNENAHGRFEAKIISAHYLGTVPTPQPIRSNFCFSFCSQVAFGRRLSSRSVDKELTMQTGATATRPTLPTRNNNNRVAKGKTKCRIIRKTIREETFSSLRCAFCHAVKSISKVKCFALSPDIFYRFMCTYLPLVSPLSPQFAAERAANAIETIPIVIAIASPRTEAPRDRSPSAAKVSSAAPMLSVTFK